MPSLQGMIMHASWNENGLTAKLGIEFNDQAGKIGARSLAHLLRRLNANMGRPTPLNCVD
jgi:hypothetical protein